jgi:hypothetical protein
MPITSKFGSWIQKIEAKTASYTVVAPADCGKIFTNRGAAGAVTFTLPDPTGLDGFWCEFFVVAAQNVIVDYGPADKGIAFNDVDADAIAFQTAAEIVGNGIRVVSDGTSWLTFVMLGAETATPTITT